MLVKNAKNLFLTQQVIFVLLKVKNMWIIFEKDYIIDIMCKVSDSVRLKCICEEQKIKSEEQIVMFC